jgi:hypothetical protein
MANVPESFSEAIAEAARKYPDDINEAVKAAEKSIRKQPDFSKNRDLLITLAVRTLVCEYRGIANAKGKNAATAGVPDYAGHDKPPLPGKPKVIMTDGVAQAIAQSCILDTYIHGKRWGAYRGDELLDVARRERNVAGGHLVNAEFGERLHEITGGDRYPGEVLTGEQADEIFRSLRSKYKLAKEAVQQAGQQAGCGGCKQPDLLAASKA